MATWGRLRRTNSSVSTCRRRSTSEEVAVMSSPIGSHASRRRRALPTRPRCPATQTRLPVRSNIGSPGVLDELLGHVHGQAHLPQVVVHHPGDELLEADGGPPAQPAHRLGRIRPKLVDLCGTEVPRVDHDERLPIQAHVPEGDSTQLPNGVPLTGANDEVLRLLLLHHQVDRTHMVTRMTPVTDGVPVP